MAGSGVTKGRRLDPQERRELIEERAAELFAEHGYEATTIAELASAAEVTKPILYRHFASKQALYLGVLAKHTSELPRFMDRVPKDGPMDKRVEAILEGWLDYVQTHPYLWNMQFGDTTGDAEILAFREAVKERGRLMLAMFIQSQKKVSPVPEDQVEPLAEFARSGMVGLAKYSIDNPEVPREALVGVGMRLFSGLVETTR
jgi:AcrR family transcriptional regulator